MSNELGHTDDAAGILSAATAPQLHMTPEHRRRVQVWLSKEQLAGRWPNLSLEEAESGCHHFQMTMNRRLLLIGAVCVLTPPAIAQNMSSEPKIAIGGYDTVAYFTVGRPVPGNPSISHQWDGRRYLFENEAHRELFVRDPEKYAPQFGGQCAAGMSAGIKIEADPRNWIISDGRLFLFGGASGPERARSDQSLLKRADANWAKLR